MAGEEGNSTEAPSYELMIMEAIEALDEKNGSSKTAISDYIESRYVDLPAAHAVILTHNLNKMKQNGVLATPGEDLYVKVEGQPEAPAKRGRGRPPKPKVAVAPAATDSAEAPASSPRPRGRPPKPRDPSAPPPAKKQKPAGTGRPRGRPKKNRDVDSGAPAAVAVPVAASPRGRGRPPKVKPAAVGVES